MSLRGATGDEAISFPGEDCFATLAMTGSREFADALLPKKERGASVNNPAPLVGRLDEEGEKK
jgi:hypothetical protein